MSLSEINLKASNRVSVLGRSGSGKTTLLKALIAAFAHTAFVVEKWSPYHIVILDTKKDDDFKGMGKKFKRLKELPKLWQDYPILIYEPIEEEMTESFYDGLIKFLRETKEPFLLIIDELSSILDKGGKAPYQYELLMKQGRGKKQVAWSGIQNPVYVPHDFLSNPDHFFVFDLLMKGDREKMRGIVGDGVMTPPPDEHGFYYFSVKGKSLHYFENNPPINFGVPENVFELIGENEGKEGKRMNVKYIMGLFALGLALLFVLAIEKKALKAAASKVSVFEPVADFVEA